jgi:hypothetical protein
MAHKDFDYDRDYGLVPDLVKQFVVYLYRHIRSEWQGQQHWAWYTAVGKLLIAAYGLYYISLSAGKMLPALEVCTSLANCYHVILGVSSTVVFATGVVCS